MEAYCACCYSSKAGQKVTTLPLFSQPREKEQKAPWKVWQSAALKLHHIPVVLSTQIN